MQNLRFSVITVCFQAEQSIGRTIESVLEQIYSPFEYWIVDGKSRDQTAEIAESYRPLFERKGIRYTVISEPDTGIYNAMNKGIRLAAGDFLSFLNAGDWYEPEALLNVNRFYREAPFDLTYGGLHYLNPDGSETIKMSRLDRFPVTSRHWNHPSMFLRREIYQQYGFDERFPAYADFHLYTRLRRTNIKIRVIPKTIAYFSAGGVSTDWHFRRVLQRAREKYRIYRDNGYSPIYWIEAYGWEMLKALYFRIKS